jgi:DNA replication protein DnaC
MKRGYPHKNPFFGFYKKLENKSKFKREISMKLDQLKAVFNKEAKNYFNLKRRTFEVDELNKNTLSLICKYFSNDETFETVHEADLSKGIYFYGKPGTGKTSIFKIIQNISKKYNLKNIWFPITSTSDVVQEFNIDKQKDFVIKKYTRGNYLFDDLGAEEQANNVYVFGKDEIFVRIIEFRYNLFITKGIKTHLTSNLNISEISKRYGKRVEDRFYEMFNFIEIKGDSRR